MILYMGLQIYETFFAFCQLIFYKNFSNFSYLLDDVYIYAINIVNIVGTCNRFKM